MSTKIEWTQEDSKLTKDYLFQLIHIGCLDKEQADIFEKLVFKAVKILEEELPQEKP